MMMAKYTYACKGQVARGQRQVARSSVKQGGGKRKAAVRAKNLSPVDTLQPITEN